MKRLTVFLVGFFMLVGLVVPVYADNPLDFNGDGRVDEADVTAARDHYGTRRGDPNWDPIYDLNNDGRIDAPNDILPVMFGITGSQNPPPGGGIRVSNGAREPSPKQAFNQALQALKQEYLDEKQALLEEKQQDIEAIKEGFSQQRQELQDQLAELGQEEQEAIDAVKAEYADQEAELKDQIDTLKEAKSEVLKALRKEFISELLTAIKEGKFGDIIGIVKDYIADRKEVKQTFDEQIQEVQEQLTGVEEEKQLAIDEVRDAFTEERQEIQDQIAALEQGEQEAIAAIEEEYAGNLAELKDEYKDKITELWHQYFGEKNWSPERISKELERIFKKFFKEPRNPKGKDRHGERGYKDEDRGERDHRDEDDEERNHTGYLGEIGDYVGDHINIRLPDNPEEDDVDGASYNSGENNSPLIIIPGPLPGPVITDPIIEEPVYNPGENNSPLIIIPGPRPGPIAWKGLRNGDNVNIPFVPSMAGKSDKYLDLRR